MDIGKVCGLGAPRVDNGHLSPAVVRKVPERMAGITNAVGLPGVGADEEHVVGMLDVFRDVTG